MVSFISLDLQHNGIEFHTAQIVSCKSSEMVDMGNKNCPQRNKQKNKIVKKADDDVQYKVKEKRINSSERLPNHFVNRIHEKKKPLRELL